MSKYVVVAIFDKVAENYVNISLVPSVGYAQRELLLASRSDPKLPFALVPSDYELRVFDLDSVSFSESVSFDSFISSSEVSSDE